MSSASSSGFGAWLVEARGAAGLTQEQLADETGVHINTIKNLEAGKTARPRADTAAALRNRLGAMPEPLEVREHYDQITQAYLDLAGAYLMQLPPEKRERRVFELTRHLVVPD